MKVGDLVMIDSQKLFVWSRYYHDKIGVIVELDPNYEGDMVRVLFDDMTVHLFHINFLELISAGAEK